ncbi:hypothetical protein EVAR_63989_1 [Eumeta japonica]|uniref:Uncharacterized protein n=1 Tax=Eumeta variegata TaxID=151549 RepID=A0A4C1ZK75_EUMVA|nr:hypothetical protein EVAR_63989_1 [Eumeta japonica]
MLATSKKCVVSGGISALLAFLRRHMISDRGESGLMEGESGPSELSHTGRKSTTEAALSLAFLGAGLWAAAHLASCPPTAS